MFKAMERNGQTQSPAPFRVGIWCDYESAIRPDEGIGVLVYNLIQGFLRLEEPLEVVLLVRPDDQKQAVSFTGKHARLRILSKLDRKPAWWTALNRFLKRWKTWSDRVHRRKNMYQERIRWFRDYARNTLGNAWKRWGCRPGSQKTLGLVLAGVGLPIFFVLLWVGYAIFKYASVTIQILTLPIRILDQGFRWLGQLFSSKEPNSSEVAQMHGCDAWIVPNVLLNHSLPFPSVVLIHDFASNHFPEQFDRWYPGYRERARQLTPLRAKQAALCVCMSNFIRDKDLLGVLKLAPSKVRVVRSAPPADLPDLDGPLESFLPKFLRRPYLFFPTAFRPYKNHGALIDALRILRDRHEEITWDLVFTGENRGYLPPELQEQVLKCGLQDRVHVLGRVDRRTLAALYHQAFATLVPSLYEQGSFQIYESLQAGCPVACSRIPPFLEQCGPMGEGMVYFDPNDPGDIARTILDIRDNREGIRQRQNQTSRVLWNRTWDHVARDFIQVCKEATPMSMPSVPEVFLFLQIAYDGGVWETTKDLMRALVEINRERRQLTMTLGVEEEQKDTAALEALAPDLSVERFRFAEISNKDGEWLLGRVSKSGPENPISRFTFMKGCESVALRADAWLALVDRFPAPLLTLRPYGVVVYDMIQRHFPQSFSPLFFRWMKEGMKPTVRDAHTVLVTSTATRDDAIAEYQLDPSRIEMVPVACEPHRRFSSLAIDPVPRARAPFILSVANASGHKGAEVLVRAYARLKKQVRGHVPLLVLAGWRTDALSPSYRGALDDKYWIRIRQLIRELGLVEDCDLACLGFVSDSQLLDLYQRCAVVVNAAKHDNGSFSLIEGAYFGRPLISSQYPAVESLCERFGISPRFFPIDDDASLAVMLEQALKEKPVQGDDLKSIRDRLRVPELSYRLYAERIYRILVELADQGRKERLSRKPPAYQPETRSTAA